MKTRFIMLHFLIFTIFFVFIGSSYSFPNEPDGYGGFRWGTSIQEYIKSGTKTLSEKDGLYFSAKLGGVDVDIGYEFFEDKLYGVIITFKEDDRGKIVEYFTARHGEPTKKKGKNRYWAGASTKISVRGKDAEIVSVSLEKEYLRAKSKRK